MYDYLNTTWYLIKVVIGYILTTYRFSNNVMTTFLCCCIAYAKFNPSRAIGVAMALKTTSISHLVANKYCLSLAYIEGTPLPFE